MAEKDILGDVAAVKMAMVGVADVVVVTDTVTITTKIIPTKPDLMHPDFILWQWNKLSFEECDKIQKEHDKKGKPSGTKCIIGDISIEQVTAIIGAMQQAQLVTPTKETELTSNTGRKLFWQQGKCQEDLYHQMTGSRPG